MSTRISPRAALFAATLLLALGTSARAGDLKIDGAAVAHKMLGVPVTITLTGAPGAPAWLLLDVSPGPASAYGLSLDLGFTPSLVPLFLGNVPAGGTVSLSGALPWAENLAGSTIYMLGVVQSGAIPALHDWSDGAALTLVPRDVQLAGNPLGGYPHFAFVSAFNAGTNVGVAVDTGLRPELVGDTADVYVTASKTRSQWIADPTLVDVSGGVETLTFAAGGITGNQVIADAGTLPAILGANVGVGYDVVIDLDQNGLFDGSDLIDGFDEAESGLYVVRDVTVAGPFAVTETIYTGGTWLGQDLYYPTNIAALSQVPIVVISHGNGHNFQWYDHIGMHLASYGLVVMSHENNTGPGIETASTTTLTNTDYLLGNLATIAGGALAGKVDPDNIVWIGHSRGGEGITRAYDRLTDGTYVATHFSAADITLMSSIAPTDFLGTNSATPKGANYHLWVGQADSDVTGCASSNIVQSFHLLDRAFNQRQSISLHGVGHGDFHAGTGGAFATGPCLVGKTDTHKIVRGHVLPLVKHHAQGDIPSRDFLWRQWESFRPIGAPSANACVHVDLQYRTASQSGKFVIDDFQSNPSVNFSSSGGTVTSSVTIVAEGRMDDENTDFTTGLPFNGFTQAAANDSAAGLVIEYSAPGDLAFSIVPAAQDASDKAFLSFRACQVTRHAFTTAVLGDLSFTVMLTDADGALSSIPISVYGGGIEEPYQRTSCGTGAGWANEFETVRIRLSDFTHQNSGLDLSRLTTVTLRFGAGFGAGQGRLGLDDLELTTE